MNPEDVFSEFASGFQKRKYAAALIVAFIDLLTDLDAPALQLADFQGFLAAFPQRVTLADGRPAATLIVERPDGRTISLRHHYDIAQRLFRETHKRYDFPTPAPYGSGKWREFVRWWDTISSLDGSQLADLRQKVIDYVLQELPSQEFDPSSIAPGAQPFRKVVADFDLSSRKGEVSGAAYQGMIFGYLRADNPHLQVEIDKVRVGSKRVSRVGDIDCWNGRRLAITAEVKQYVLSMDDTIELGDFATRAKGRGAIAIVAALGFQDGVREEISAKGAVPVAREDLLTSVALWDPVKQTSATKAMEYYYDHIEQNSALTARFDAFLDDSLSRREPIVEEYSE